MAPRAYWKGYLKLSLASCTIPQGALPAWLHETSSWCAEASAFRKSVSRPGF